MYACIIRVIIYVYRDIYSMYMDMYDSTFIGKQLNNLQKVKDFYAEQVSHTYRYMKVQ